jgi:hypothetical protein
LQTGTFHLDGKEYAIQPAYDEKDEEEEVDGDGGYDDLTPRRSRELGVRHSVRPVPQDTDFDVRGVVSPEGGTCLCLKYQWVIGILLISV